MGPPCCPVGAVWCACASRSCLPPRLSVAWEKGRRRSRATGFRVKKFEKAVPRGTASCRIMAFGPEEVAEAIPDLLFFFQHSPIPSSHFFLHFHDLLEQAMEGFPPWLVRVHVTKCHGSFFLLVASRASSAMRITRGQQIEKKKMRRVGKRKQR